MAQFRYEATTEDERTMRGSVEAASLAEARQTLEGMALTIQQIERQEVVMPRSALGKNEFLLFNQQLSAITEAGVPLERALREMARDVASSRVEKVLRTIADELEVGRPLEEVFASHQKLFPPMYSQLIKAGVKTGKMSSLLASLNRHLEMVHQTRRILLEAAIYPLTVLVVVLVLATVLLHVAIPSIQSMYNGLNGEIPEFVGLVFRATQYTGAFWTLLSASIIGGIVGYVMLKRTASGRKQIERVLLKLPVLGWVYRASILTRFSDAMGLLVGGGLDLPEGLRLSGASAGCELLAEECERWAQQIEQGKSLQQAAEVCKFIPAYFLFSVQVGEHRNELQDAFYFLSGMYTHQVQAIQGRLQAALMPFFLLVVGLIVGVLSVALLGPYFMIFQMADAVR